MFNTGLEVIKNIFENFTEVDSYDRVIDIEMSCSENILKGFKFPITIDCEKFDRNTLLEINTSRIINDQDFGIFTDNYIENMYGVLTNNSHFTFNTIININNANITNHNQFNNNILNNIYGNIINNGDGIFDNNSIEELKKALSSGELDLVFKPCVRLLIDKGGAIYKKIRRVIFVKKNS
jgi:hypothetical protein